jgi:hypothetical protein
MTKFVLTVLGASCLLSAQVPLPSQIPQTRFERGQNIVPVFEGWVREADGFTFVFGYFNRNWSEEIVLPPGPDNNVEPGGADQGQPTFFAPRRQSWVYRVHVPKDWGQKELVWTLNAHGKPEKAYASLLLEYEITERLIMSRGNLSPGDGDPNKPPSVTISPVTAASVGTPLSLTALVNDDGLPKPRVPAAPKSGSAPAQSDRPTQARLGLSVTWSEYRGPAKAVFDPPGATPVANGKGAAIVRFTEPGTYVLRATATDGALQTRSEITVNVLK